jgi:hypothetical protein
VTEAEEVPDLVEDEVLAVAAQVIGGPGAGASAPAGDVEVGAAALGAGEGSPRVERGAEAVDDLGFGQEDGDVEVVALRGGESEASSGPVVGVLEDLVDGERELVGLGGEWRLDEEAVTDGGEVGVGCGGVGVDGEEAPPGEEDVVGGGLLCARVIVEREEEEEEGWEEGIAHAVQLPEGLTSSSPRELM